jgi:hypothetical protein
MDGAHSTSPALRRGCQQRYTITLYPRVSGTGGEICSSGNVPTLTFSIVNDNVDGGGCGG